MLMQGLPLPSPSVCTPKPLPPAKQRPSSPPLTPTNPHVFHEPADTSGRACVRGSLRRITPAPLPVQSTLPTPATSDTPVFQPTSNVFQLEEAEVKTTIVSRTTAWRQRKRSASVSTLPSAQASTRKYTCTICGDPMSSVGHSQFYGKRYCPNASGQVPKEEWLAQRRAEKKERRID